MTLPIKPVKKPLDLAGKKNGKLPAKILSTVKPDPTTLHHKAARAWTALRAAAKQDNVILAHVGDYRTYEEQVALFVSRYSLTPTGSGESRVWNGKTWYKKPGVATVAVPGTSNHGWGLAIDAALIVDGKLITISADPDGSGPIKSGVAWLLKNADAYGFSWELQSEPWHIRYYAGSRLPRAVRQYEASKKRLS